MTVSNIVFNQVANLAGRVSTITNIGYLSPSSLTTTGAVSCVSWNADPPTLVTGSEDGLVKLWDPCSGKLLGVLDPDASNRRVRGEKGFIYILKGFGC